MTDIDLYASEYQRFRTSTLYSSGLGLLMAAASRIPASEVSSPVGWIITSLNVGILPIFGPAFILGTFTYTHLALLDLTRLRKALLASEPSPIAVALLEGPWIHFRARRRTLSQLVEALVSRFWCLGIPVVAYIILICSFFDFVRPAKPDSEIPMYETRSTQIVDLLIGTGGWSGFRPLAPSIQNNLKAIADTADDKEKGKLRRLARSVPWIYPPWQTWAYLCGLTLLILMTGSANRVLSDSSNSSVARPNPSNK